jgi:hypothetical protein
MVILFIRLPAQPSFQELLDEVKRAVQDALRHQDFSLRDLSQRLDRPELSEQRDLFRVLFNFVPLPAGKVSVPGVEVEPFELSERSSMVMRDLVMSMSDRGALGMSAALDYRSDMFDAEAIRGFVDDFEHCLLSIGAAPAAEHDVPGVGPDGADSQGCASFSPSPRRP